MKITLNSFFICGIASFVLMTFSGCCMFSPKIKAYNVNLSLDESLQGSTIQVDLIGFNEGNLSRYKSYSVSNYFGDPDDRIRNLSEKKQFIFGQGQPMEQAMLDTDPMWEVWLDQEKALYLLALVDLPGVIEDKDAQSDPRRLIMPLDKCLWQGNVKTIDIVISEVNVYSLQNFEDENL